MSGQLRIAGARVYDPANGVDGQVRDICIEAGRVVDSLPADVPRLDARGLVAMPGGVDVHSHIAGPTVNLARRLRPEEGRADPHPGLGTLRSGRGGTVPSTWVTGYRYAGLGYTTVFEAAVAPSGARSAHAELQATPVVDSGIFLLLGNDELLLRAIAAREPDRVRELAAWYLRACGAYAIKIVNPGGVAAWKRGRGDVSGLDEEAQDGATPRAIVRELAAAADALGLPHPVHVHCNQLGVAGNADITLETMRAVEGRAHFTHLQFHCYGGEPGERPTSRAAEVVEYLNAHPELTADVGQVLFGPATAMTADGPVGLLLHRLGGKPWVNVDVELETGCGVVPYEYRERKRVHALQFAVGLELFLLARDPWRLALSTDHPNGASFLAYPRIVRLLMDRAFRDEVLAGLPDGVLEGSALADGVEREYTLGEIAIVTRAGPARILGLERKGHLGAGADADVTLYADDPQDREAMFRSPRYVLKGGRVLVEEGELRAEVAGRRLRVRPEGGVEGRREAHDFLERWGSMRPGQLELAEEEVAGPAAEEGG